MKKNMGTADRLIRLIIALLIGAAYYSGIITGTLAIILVVFGVVFVLTSSVGFCPLYTLFGASTCKKKDE